jgi:uncharacterized protein (DUF58 family)
METVELLKKVRKIEIKTKGLSNHIFSGEYHTAFKGRGMNFSEVREYQFGDDTRSIDWNVTARFSHPFVKVFEEERELSVMLLVDVSESALFGTSQRKRDLITEICAVLAFSAINNNDKVGVIFFSGKVEKYIPLKKGRFHILRVIRELLSVRATQGGTRLAQTLKFFNNVAKKKSIVFLLSDFICPDYMDALNIASKKHDVIGIHVYDLRDRELPAAGTMHLQDSETGKTGWVDSSDVRVRNFYARKFDEHLTYCRTAFLKSGADLISIRTDQDYVKALQGFFATRI